MTRRIITILFSVIHSFATFSQSDSIFRDDFASVSQWPVDVRESSYAYFENERYVFVNKEEKKSDIFIKNFDFKPTEEYKIESAMSMKSGTLYNEFGLVWGAKDKENFHCFVITATGIVRIFSKKDNITTIQLDPTLIDLVSQNMDNVLSIEKKEGEIHYYINQIEIYAHSVIPIYGTGMGFFVSGNTSVSADYFEFRHKPLKRELSNDLSKTLKKINIGSSINTKYNELVPVISYDGNTLFFSRMGHPQNNGDEKKEDIWYSLKDNQGNWSQAKNIGKPLNNSENNSIISVSPDGNMLLLSNTYRKDGSPYKEEGVSVSFRNEKGEWDVPIPVYIEDLKNINKFKNFCLGSDRKTLLMAIEDETSFGNLDLYISFLKYDTDSSLYWTKPQNLGSDVNTFAADFSPFLAADGKTLYYSTSGFPGFGDADIYKTVRLDSTWKKWTKPLNMGQTVNTSEFDAYFSIPASGDVAYFVSEEGSVGGSDIFFMPLIEELQPEPVVLVYGKVLNKKTDAPIHADIKYFNLFTDNEAGIASSEPQYGKYSIVLPAGFSYSFFAQKEGFYPVSDNIDLTAVKDYTVIERNLFLAPIETGKAIRLNNIFFHYDKAELLPTSNAELDRLVKLLNDFPAMIIEISGHTDSDGGDEYNMKLSEARAKAVVNYIISKNISQERLSYRGFGETMPIATNTTKEGKALNRRVEFTILRK